MDGYDISTMKHMDAVNVLRATDKVVKLKVLRRPKGVSCLYNACTFSLLAVSLSELKNVTSIFYELLSFLTELKNVVN